MAFFVAPLDDTNDLSCHELPASDELPTVAVDEALGLAEATVPFCTDEVLSALVESELHADKTSADIVSGTAINRYLRWRVSMQPAYVRLKANQGF